jgi:hypothetical protein
VYAIGLFVILLTIIGTFYEVRGGLSFSMVRRLHYCCSAWLRGMLLVISVFLHAVRRQNVVVVLGAGGCGRQL